jgi:hypothetical protein
VSATASARGLIALVGAAVCVALAAFAVIGRAKVVAFAPGAVRLYAAAGLPVQAPGLDFRLVVAEVVGTGSETALVVQGEIANMSGSTEAVPAIELTVRNADGQPFYTWTSEPPRRTLPPGEAARFWARLAAPPPEGTQVLVRFASVHDGAVPGTPPSLGVDSR